MYGNGPLLGLLLTGLSQRDMQGLVEVLIRGGMPYDYLSLLLSPMRTNLLRHFLYLFIKVY